MDERTMQSLSRLHFLFFKKLRLIRGRLDKIISPILATIYKINPNKIPVILLTSLGIANLRTHHEFITLDKIINSLDNINGDIIECGVYKGKTLLGIAHILRKKGINTQIFGLDTFEGNPSPSHEDKLGNGKTHPHAKKGYYDDVSFEALNKKIHHLGFSDQIQLLRGEFQSTLPILQDKSFSIVHLDCSLYRSYKTCLEFLYDKVLPGGYIIFDDYGELGATFPGAQRAIDEFFKNKPETIECFKGLHEPRYFIKKL